MPWSRRCEKKRASHIVHSPLSWTSSTPAARSRAVATALRSTLRPSDRLGDVGERVAHLVADLVAAASGAGADRSDDGPARPDVAQRGDALVEHAGREAAPARVHHRDRARSAEGDGKAVGREDQHRDAGDVRGDAVGLRSLPVGQGASAQHLAAVDLRAARKGRAVGELTQAVVVGRDRLRVVPRALAEVE